MGAVASLVGFAHAARSEELPGEGETREVSDDSYYMGLLVSPLSRPIIGCRRRRRVGPNESIKRWAKSSRQSIRSRSHNYNVFRHLPTAREIPYSPADFLR